MTVGFSQSVYDVSEGIGTATICIALDIPTEVAIVVDILISDVSTIGPFAPNELSLRCTETNSQLSVISA